MVSSSKVRGKTERHAHTVRRIGKVGYVAYGVIHLLVAWLAVQIAFGGSGKSADTSGALAQLRDAPLGRVLLVVMMLGLIALALWKILQAILGVDGEDGGKEIAKRVGSGAQAVVFIVLAVSAGKFAFSSGSSSGGKQQGATGKLLGLPGGQVLTVIAGLVVIGVAVGMAIFGLKRSFEKSMALGTASPKTRRAVVALGVAGYVAKGVAYTVVGILLIAAAVTFDPKKSRGLDSALHTLAGEPLGKVLLVAVALGIACFGVFCFARARFQRR